MRPQVDRENIDQRLRAREFDLIVFGSICHDMLARRGLDDVTAPIPDEFPFWDTVIQHYPPAQVYCRPAIW